MQNDLLFKEIFDEIKTSHYILIVIPKNASCDTISSSLALSNCFFESKIKHKVYYNSDKSLNKLNFLSKYDKVSNSLPKFYDLIIYINQQENEYANFVINKETKILSFHAKKKTSNSSSSELMHNFLNVNDLKISKNIAECLYTGIYDYSNGFTNDTNANTFDIVSSLVNHGVDVSLISNNLLQRDPLSKFKCINQVLNTLELFNEGKLASIYLDDNLLKETGARVEECDEVLNKVLSIGIVDIVVYFRSDGDKIKIFLKSKKNVDISYLITKFMIKTKKPFTFNVDSNNIFETKKKTINTILNYILS